MGQCDHPRFWHNCWWLVVLAVGLPLVGIILLPLGAVQFAEISGLSLDSEFPPMSGTDSDPAGTCTVVGMWHREVVRRETCGKNCQHDVCYDDWVAEFAWSGGTLNTPAKPTVYGNQIKTRRDHNCARGCDRYGGWNLTETVDRSKYDASAVSQAWSVMRCEKCVCRDEEPFGSISDHERKGIEAAAKVDANEEKAAADIAVGAQVTCRLPAGGSAESVNEDVFDCPGANYNALCARLGNLAQIELNAKTKGAFVLLLIGAIFLPVGICLSFVLFFVCKGFSRDAPTVPSGAQGVVMPPTSATATPVAAQAPTHGMAIAQATPVVAQAMPVATVPGQPVVGAELK